MSSGDGPDIRNLLLTGMDRRAFLRWAALVGVGAASMMLAGCGRSEPDPTPATPSEQTPATPGEDDAPAGPVGDIIIVHGVDTEALHPYVTTSFASKGMMRTMYDQLYYIAPDMSYYPGLALSHQLINDTTWEFKLRDGVTFHNGEKFTGDHVKESFAHWVDPDVKNVNAGLLAPVEDVEVLDPLTIRVHTREPYALLPGVLAFYVDILPHAITRGEVDPMQTCIGSGPFEFVEWVPGERLVVRARPDGHFTPQPLVNQISFRPVPEGAARVVELKTGRAQLVTPINPVQVAEIEAEPDLDIIRFRGGQTQLLHLNSLARTEFEDVRVRQALCHAVDIDLLVDTIMMGCAYRLASIFGPGMTGYDASIEPYEYDPDRARQLLADAGYAEGFDLELSTPNGRYLNDRRLCEAIAEMWTDIGVRTSVKVFDWGPYVEGVLGKTHEAFYFQIGGQLTQQPIAINFHSGIKGAAWQGYHNEEVNQIIEDAPRTMDPEEMERLYQRMARIVRDEAPVVVLFNQQGLWGANKAIRDWEAHPDTTFRLGNLRYEA